VLEPDEGGGMNLLNRNCATPDACRIVQNGPASMTLAYYPPAYDGHGNNLNIDRNTISMPMVCQTCGKSWNAGSGQP
jgi:hypothetical protein